MSDMAQKFEADKKIKHEFEQRKFNQDYACAPSNKRALSEIDLDPSDARITMQLEFVAEQIGILSSLLYELEERITPILLPPYPQPSDPEEPTQATSEISRIIDEHNIKLSDLQQHIRNINRRIQL